jgi:flavorubredoxin
MFVFDATSGILFSGDAFSTTVSEWRILTDEDMTELLQVYFDINVGDSASARDAISRLKMLDIKLLAPGHGPMMRRHIDRYIDALSERYAEAA